MCPFCVYFCYCTGVYLNFLQTCQKLVQIAPCDSLALQMLGNAQLAQYENDPDTDSGKQFLVDAKKSFLTSIQMEGKPNVGDPPFDLTGESLVCVV